MLDKSENKKKKSTKLDKLYHEILGEIAGEKNLSKSELMERLIFEYLMGNITLDNLKKKDFSYYPNEMIDPMLKNKKKLLDKQLDANVTLKKIYYALIRIAYENEEIPNTEGIYINYGSSYEIKEENYEKKRTDEIIDDLKRQQPIRIKVSKNTFERFKEILNKHEIEIDFETEIGKNTFWIL